MKNLIVRSKLPVNYLFLFVIFNTSLLAQNFTWKKGSSSTDVPGIYGTQGTPSITNRPGSREFAVTWTDAAGDFWLFGGNGCDVTGNIGLLNDLWKYNTSTNEWTWMKGSNLANQVGIYGSQGIYSATNIPGGRKGASSFKDGLGNLWVFGGYGYDSFGSFGELNDLWTYDPSTNQWRWMKGAVSCFQVGVYGTQGTGNFANTPGARYRANCWTDGNGEFWLFGGLGYNGSSNSYLNDLWRYNSSNNQWIWMKGTAFLDQAGIYGTQGTSAPTNAPGARCSSATITDGSGNFWMIGGYGYTSSGFANLMNDMWVYKVVTNEWTWIKGSSTAVQQGTYGVQGSFAAANLPGARYDATTWLDGGGNIWMFGGYGYGAGPALDYLNDLWRYDLISNQWKWVRGSTSVAQPGIYGTQGVNNPLNMPGGRSAMARWKDNSNNLWLLGGTGYNIANNVGRLSDLWKFDNCINPNIVISSTSPSVCAGKSATLSASGASTYTWSTAQVSGSLVIAPMGTTSYTIFGTDANGCKDTADFTLNVGLLPIISISSNSLVVCPFQPAVLTASGAATYSWSHTQDPNPSVTINPGSTTSYTVRGTDLLNCSNVASFSQSVSLCTSIQTQQVKGSGVSLFPNPTRGEITIQTTQFGKKELIIVNDLGQTVFEQELEPLESKLTLLLDKGIYFFRVVQNTVILSAGKLIVE